MTDEEDIKRLEKLIESQDEKIKELSDRQVELRLDVAKLITIQGQLIAKLDNFSSGINRGLWIIGGGFISAFITWIVGGGLDR
jgi:uncharacterized coiled-coil protein SlyX